jgi:hypothetical protein
MMPIWTPLIFESGAARAVPGTLKAAAAGSAEIAAFPKSLLVKGIKPPG